MAVNVYKGVGIRAIAWPLLLGHVNRTQPPVRHIEQTHGTPSKNKKKNAQKKKNNNSSHCTTPCKVEINNLVLVWLVSFEGKKKGA